MFRKKQKEELDVLEPNNETPTEVLKEVFSSPENQRAYELASSLGFERQKTIIKMKELGYRAVQRDKLSSLFEMKAGETVHLEYINKFTGEIPFGVMCKVNEVLEKKLFHQ